MNPPYTRREFLAVGVTLAALNLETLSVNQIRGKIERQTTENGQWFGDLAALYYEA